ncbi:MAG: Gfo/Idh/MocA family oxidoreductase, partial [Deltaproteobacteria bacterium]|nr:Gfo/Idh/MocA family oxidoreductase [Deltaproteobacteria bacterium]
MTVRVGIVGWGEIGRVHASCLASAGAEFSGVVSRQKNPDTDVPVYRTLDDMLPHVDAVTIAVPNHLHAPLCLQAVQAGKAVMV